MSEEQYIYIYIRILKPKLEWPRTKMLSIRSDDLESRASVSLEPCNGR